MASFWGSTSRAAGGAHTPEGEPHYLSSSSGLYPVDAAGASPPVTTSSLFHYPLPQVSGASPQPHMSDDTVWNSAASRASSVTLARLRLAYELNEQQRNQAALHRARTAIERGHGGQSLAEYHLHSPHSPRSSGSISPQPLQSHPTQHLTSALGAFPQPGAAGSKPVSLQDARWLADQLARSPPLANNAFVHHTQYGLLPEEHYNSVYLQQAAQQPYTGQGVGMQALHPAYAGNQQQAYLAGRSGSLRAWQSAPPFNRNVNRRACSMPNTSPNVRAFLHQGAAPRVDLQPQYPGAWPAGAAPGSLSLDVQSDAEAYSKLEKRIRAVRKRLRQIEEIKAKAYDGKPINMDQEQKLRKEVGFRTELAHLELACSLIQRTAQASLQAQPSSQPHADAIGANYIQQGLAKTQPVPEHGPYTPAVSSMTCY